MERESQTLPLPPTPFTLRVLRGYFAGMFREAHPFASSRIQTHENLFKYASSDLRVYVSNASDKA
jgi:hypothetical protein